MKLNKLAVSTTDIAKSVQFYTILGLEFPEYKEDEQHVESIYHPEGATLMIDTVKMIKEISGHEPTPSTHSAFAIEYDTKEEIDSIADKLRAENFRIEKYPWEAFWGQYYAIVEDPEGYKVDLYVNL